MGMFDRVNYSHPCPICEETIHTFQSKDGDCQLDLIDPPSVRNFYGDCECGVWVEFQRHNNTDQYERTVSRMATNKTYGDIDFAGMTKLFDPCDFI